MCWCVGETMSIAGGGWGWSSGPLSPEEIERRVNSPVATSVVYDPESMRSFKNRVDELITKLEGSPAGRKKVAAEPLERGQFGGGGGAWTEAAGLFTSYQTVIDQLRQLSGLLSNSLEGMGIAVVASKDGFGQLDDDIRRRMRMIYQNAEEHYDPQRDPHPPETVANANKPQNEPDEPNEPTRPSERADGSSPGDAGTAGVGGFA